MEFWADMDVHDFIILSTAKLLELNCFIKLWGKFIAIFCFVSEAGSYNCDSQKKRIPPSSLILPFITERVMWPIFVEVCVNRITVI